LRYSTWYLSVVPLGLLSLQDTLDHRGPSPFAKTIGVVATVCDVVSASLRDPIRTPSTPAFVTVTVPAAPRACVHDRFGVICRLPSMDKLFPDQLPTSAGCVVGRKSARLSVLDQECASRFAEALVHIHRSSLPAVDARRAIGEDKIIAGGNGACNATRDW
jgi:hypothetical protein